MRSVALDWLLWMRCIVLEVSSFPRHYCGPLLRVCWAYLPQWIAKTNWPKSFYFVGWRRWRNFRRSSTYCIIRSYSCKLPVLFIWSCVIKNCKGFSFCLCSKSFWCNWCSINSQNTRGWIMHSYCFLRRIYVNYSSPNLLVTAPPLQGHFPLKYYTQPRSQITSADGSITLNLTDGVGGNGGYNYQKQSGVGTDIK